MQCRKNRNLETLQETASKLLDFEKYYFNSIYRIPADKGIFCSKGNLDNATYQNKRPLNGMVFDR